MGVVHNGVVAEHDDFEDDADDEDGSSGPAVVIKCPSCGDEDLYGLEGEMVECENCGEPVHLTDK